MTRWLRRGGRAARRRRASWDRAVVPGVSSGCCLPVPGAPPRALGPAAGPGQSCCRPPSALPLWPRSGVAAEAAFSPSLVLAALWGWRKEEADVLPFKHQEKVVGTCFPVVQGHGGRHHRGRPRDPLARSGCWRGVAWALLAAAVEAVPMRCASSREQRCTPDNPGETCIAGESQRRLQLGREKGDLEMKRRGG